MQISIKLFAKKCEPFKVMKSIRSVWNKQKGHNEINTPFSKHTQD